MENPDFIQTIKKPLGSLGVLHLKWKSLLGEPGENSLDIIDFPSQDKRKIAIVVTNLPKQFFLEEVFTLQLKVQNRSDAVLRPQIIATLGGKTGVLVVGNCSGMTSEIPPGGQSTPVSLSFLPVRAGILHLPRLIVHDLLTNAQNDWGIPFPIFVERRDHVNSDNVTDIACAGNENTAGVTDVPKTEQFDEVQGENMNTFEVENIDLNEDISEGKKTQNEEFQENFGQSEIVEQDTEGTTITQDTPKISDSTLGEDPQ